MGSEVREDPFDATLSKNANKRAAFHTPNFSAATVRTIHLPGIISRYLPTLPKPPHWLKKYSLFLLLILSIVVGSLAGFYVRMHHPDWTGSGMHAKRKRMYLQYPGELFLRMLKSMIIPLIVTSLSSGMAGLPSHVRGKLGGCAVLYFACTSFLAVLTGILLAVAIKPGNYAEQAEKHERVQMAADFVLDLIRNMFPDNIIAAAFTQTGTEYETVRQMVNVTDDNGTTHEVSQLVIIDFKVIQAGTTNILGMVVFCMVLGLIIGTLREKGKPIKECIQSLALALIEMVNLVVAIAPIGICFLLAERIVRMDDPKKEFQGLAAYVITVTAGLLIHGTIVLPLVYFFFTRKNPFVFALHMMDALVMALGTSSSSATLPVTIRCMKLKAKVDARIGGFMLPVGATINMDGTALYEAVASIFIAQVNNIQLGIGELITIWFTSAAASVGAAGVPEAGLLTMSIVLTAVGIPADDVAIIISVDWLVDRFCTCVNIWGDAIGCGVIEALTLSHLVEIDDNMSTAEHDPYLAYSNNNNVPTEEYGYQIYENPEPSEDAPSTRGKTGSAQNGQ